MPHTRSAKKNLRKSEKHRLRNRAAKKAIKTQIKKVLALQAGSLDVLTKEFQLAAKKLDKAAAKGIVHPNLAARKKSQMAKLVYAKSKSSAAAK
jgi:small subunit ribosomal protein S20